jgi:hypothetical protein
MVYTPIPSTAARHMRGTGGAAGAKCRRAAAPRSSLASSQPPSRKHHPFPRSGTLWEGSLHILFAIHPRPCLRRHNLRLGRHGGDFLDQLIAGCLLELLALLDHEHERSGAADHAVLRSKDQGSERRDRWRSPGSA